MPHGDDQHRQDEIEREPGYQGPPHLADLQWGPGKVVNTSRGERKLAKARPTAEFERIWDQTFRELGEFGFQNGYEGVLFWERPDLDHTALAELIDSLPDLIAKKEAEAARVEQEHLERQEREAAAERERHREFIEEARETARISLRDKRWSWAKAALIDEANKLIDDPALDYAGAKRLKALAGQASKNVVRSEQRIAVAHEPELARAANPVVVAAAKDAIASITWFDQDWASLQNDIGWSKATTCDGHVLDGLTVWTVEQASHALRLLRIHHGQVPDRLPLTLASGRQATLSLSPAA
ncbi:hypothetical protein HCU64_09845 [Methylobacterium sp. C25]|uniref:hypothetical protein n=1 Tax=Methylobacterium sp. C25 TaxID=2721622 RepID=UPI001F26086F|nr:hypothetical protein [Methylobacterium sp. C25]MCE4224053.1 hypothetical protein [Methylobacterium sp. C25]